MPPCWAWRGPPPDWPNSRHSERGLTRVGEIAAQKATPQGIVSVLASADTDDGGRSDDRAGSIGSAAPVRQYDNVDLHSVVVDILERPGPVRLVAIDGPGGAGKSTLAAQLSKNADNAPVVHTDDFASADNPVNWWPRLQSQVIDPLAKGSPTRYQRYDWPSNALDEWHLVLPAPIVIIEGVTAGRSEWAEQLSYLIWVETPRAERLRRGLHRDGTGALNDWEVWMSGEDEHYRSDPTRDRADLIVDGTHAR